MNKCKKLSVEELMERWEWLKWCMGFEELLVTEHFHNGVENVYIVSGLAMELEQDWAVCSDYNNVLLMNNSRLVMFLQNNLTTITLMPYKDWYREELVFANRIIYIEKVS